MDPTTAESIVTDLAALDAPIHADKCALCWEWIGVRDSGLTPAFTNDLTDHASTCPWRRAKEAVEHG